MSTLFVIDIDATLADATDRLKFAGQEPSRKDAVAYNTWLAAVQDANSLLQDKPVAGMVDLVSAIRKGSLNVVLVTAREEHWRDVTEAWLIKNKLPKLPLIMRPNDNFYESAMFKATEISELKTLFGCDSVIVIDDDQSGELQGICKYHGWTFLKALSGGGH